MRQAKAIRILKWMIAFVVILLVYCWRFGDYWLNATPNWTENHLYLAQSIQNESSTPLVLLWTDLFGNNFWHQESYFNGSPTISCPNNHRCKFTRQRNNLFQASIVAFHLYDTNRRELPVRDPIKSKQQNWIFVTGESPINFYYQNPSFYPKMFENYFDSAISYKDDSQFPVFSSALHIRSAHSVSHEQISNKISIKKKKKPIVWMVSNCFTFSQREKYVKELSKWISIDIYGGCGKKCGETRQCQVDLDEYYFYLSFENSRCNSYITEKFWNILKDNQNRLVPIVMGPKRNHYVKIAPNNSFIHIDEYPTAQKLAEYLLSLIENPDQYLAYLRWRETIELRPWESGGWTNLLCPLCSLAYQINASITNRLKFSTWFNPATECHQDDTNILMTCKQTSLQAVMRWIHQIQCPT